MAIIPESRTIEGVSGSCRKDLPAVDTGYSLLHMQPLVTEEPLVLSIRPTVAEHAFYIFGRSVHPELFGIHRTRIIDRKNYRARIDITNDGHVVSFTSRGSTITEIVCSTKQTLPQKRIMRNLNLRGKNVEELEGKKGISYHSQFELERVKTDLFWMVHNQLQSSKCNNELLHTFDSSGRIAFGAVSFVHVEERERQLMVQAFHTFPDDCGIVKSVSTFSTTSRS